MCYQKVNQNWRKSNPLPSPVQSRFNPLHTVTPWTLQAPANNRPHSTSSQPPPTGTGTAKCISPSRSLHPAPGVQSSYHIFSFEIWSFKHLDLFLKIYYSLSVWQLQFWHTYARVIFAKVIFTQLTLQTLGISAMECSSFKGKLTSRWRNSALLLSWLFVLFSFLNTLTSLTVPLWKY